MHICIVSPTPITERENLGGVRTHTKMLCEILIKLGHNVTLITTSQQNELSEELFNGVQIVYMNNVQSTVINFEWVKELCEIFWKIHKQNPFHCIFSEGYFAYGLQKKLNSNQIPIFTFVHNFYFKHFYNNFQEVNSIHSLLSYLLRNVPSLFFRMLRYEIPFLHSSDYVISVSMLNAKYLQKVYRIPEHKLKVIHNWIDTSNLSPNNSFRKHYRQKLNISEGNLVFLLVGRISWSKGFQIALEAFKKIIAQVPNAFLLVAGKGENEIDLRSRVAKSKLIKDKVKFLGWYNSSELPYLYNCADVFLLPSLRSEGHAYTLIEAMACGLSVIATRRGGNIETVGDAGILVPPGDTNSLAKAMLELAKDIEKRRILSEKARKQAVHLFSEEVAGKKISQLFKNFYRNHKL